MKFKLLLIVITTLLVLIVLGVLINKPTINNEENNNYIVTHYVKELDDIWEVRVNTVNKQVGVYKNNTKMQEYYSETTPNTQRYMELPIVDDFEIGVNIEEETPYIPLTWESNTYKSGQYLKYLTKVGYKERRIVKTPSYIEVYMTKDNTMKRIIISNDSIIIGDVVNKTLPDVINYLSNQEGL